MRKEYNDVKCMACGRVWVVCSCDLAEVDGLFCTFCGSEVIVVCGEYDDLNECMTKPPRR